MQKILHPRVAKVRNVKGGKALCFHYCILYLPQSPDILTFIELKRVQRVFNILRLICPGDSVLLGGHNLPQYLYAWFREEYLSDTLSTQSHLWGRAVDTLERYVLKVKDFKFDETYDTVSIIPSFTACRPNGFIVYPNPTNYDVTFKFDNLIPPLLEITFYNKLGQPILVHRPAISYETHTTTIMLAHLPAGVYSYAVRIDRQSFPHGKIVVVK